MAPGGNVVYAGPVQDVTAYLANVAGYPIPPSTNPAEFLIDLVTIDTEDDEQAVHDRERIAHLVKTFQVHQSQQPIKQPIMTVPAHPSDNSQQIATCTNNSSSATAERIVRRFCALLLRSWRQNVRNTKYNGYQILAYVWNAYIVCAICPTVQGKDITTNSLMQRTSLLTGIPLIIGIMVNTRAVAIFG